MLDTQSYIVLAPIAAVAGFIRGFAGFGGPLVLLPALNIYLAPAASVAVVMWVDLFANVRLLPEVYREAQPLVVLPLTAGTLIAMPFGVLLLVAVDPVLMKRAISAAILLAALVLLSGWRYQGAIGRRGWLAVGALAGFIMGATSLAVTAALFLHAGAQTARQSRANFIVWVFVATLAFLLMVAVGTNPGGRLLPIILVLAPIYLAGSYLGSRLNTHAPEAVVRRAVLILVLVIATVGLVV